MNLSPETILGPRYDTQLIVRAVTLSACRAVHDRQFRGRQKPSEAPYVRFKCREGSVMSRQTHHPAGQKLIPGPGAGCITRNQIAASQIAVPTTKTIVAKTRSRVLKCS
jgi:hypothetical protein